MSVPLPAATAAGLAAPTPDNCVRAATVSAIVAFPVRDCASLIEAAIDFAPALVAPLTVARKEKMWSLATASPLVPSSYNGCVAEPPIAVRSALTASPELAGFVPERR